MDGGRRPRARRGRSSIADRDGRVIVTDARAGDRASGGDHAGLHRRRERLSPRRGASHRLSGRAGGRTRVGYGHRVGRPRRRPALADVRLQEALDGARPSASPSRRRGSTSRPGISVTLQWRLRLASMRRSASSRARRAPSRRARWMIRRSIMSRAMAQSRGWRAARRRRRAARRRARSSDRARDRRPSLQYVAACGSPRRARSPRGARRRDGFHRRATMPARATIGALVDTLPPGVHRWDAAIRRSCRSTFPERRPRLGRGFRSARRRQHLRRHETQWRVGESSVAANATLDAAGDLTPVASPARPRRLRGGRRTFLASMRRRADRQARRQRWRRWPTRSVRSASPRHGATARRVSIAPIRASSK